MTYTIRISNAAKLETHQIYDYFSDYSSIIADKNLVRLTDTIFDIGRDPHLWSYFFLTGAPYRARLFFIGRTSFWIIYECNESEQTVNILRIWNSKRDPSTLEL